MRPTDMQRQRGFAVDPAGKPTNRILNHHEPLPLPKSNLLDDTLEAQTKVWEFLWIDMGGEG
jgi:hypothetical protein